MYIRLSLARSQIYRFYEKKVVICHPLYQKLRNLGASGYTSCYQTLYPDRYIHADV